MATSHPSFRRQPYLTQTFPLNLPQMCVLSPLNDELKLFWVILFITFFCATQVAEGGVPRLNLFPFDIEGSVSDGDESISDFVTGSTSFSSTDLTSDIEGSVSHGDESISDFVTVSTSFSSTDLTSDSTSEFAATETTTEKRKIRVWSL